MPGRPAMIVNFLPSPGTLRRAAKTRTKFLARNQGCRVFKSMSTAITPDKSAAPHEGRTPSADPDLLGLPAEDFAGTLIQYVIVPDPGMVRELLDSGVHGNILSQDGRTAFCESLDIMEEWTASESCGGTGSARVEKGLPQWDRALEVFKLLQQAGGKDLRPLVRAAGAGNLEEVRSLLDGGTPANFRSSRLGTALTAALENGRLEVARLLLARGADPNQPGRLVGVGAGPYPIQIAARSEALLRLILEAGGDPALRLPGPKGTPAIFAATIPDSGVARILFALPEFCRMKDSAGRGPAHCMDVDSCRACEDFLAPGDINALSAQWRSPLYEAVCADDDEKAQWLLDRGADPGQLCFCRFEREDGGRECRLVLSTPAVAARMAADSNIVGEMLRKAGEASDALARSPFSYATVSWRLPRFPWTRRRLAARLAEACDLPAGARPDSAGLPKDEMLVRMIGLAIHDPGRLNNALGRRAVWKWEKPPIRRPAKNPRVEAAKLAKTAQTRSTQSKLLKIAKRLDDVREAIDDGRNTATSAAIVALQESVSHWLLTLGIAAIEIKSCASLTPSCRAELAQLDEVNDAKFQRRMSMLTMTIGKFQTMEELDEDEREVFSAHSESVADGLRVLSQQFRKIAASCRRAAEACGESTEPR